MWNREYFFHSFKFIGLLNSTSGSQFKNPWNWENSVVEKIKRTFWPHREWLSKKELKLIIWGEKNKSEKEERENPKGLGLCPRNVMVLLWQEEGRDGEHLCGIRLEGVELRRVLHIRQWISVMSWWKEDLQIFLKGISGKHEVVSSDCYWLAA